jgi:hypothetical protein
MKILNTMLAAFALFLLCINLKAHDRRDPQKDIYQVGVVRNLGLNGKDYLLCLDTNIPFLKRI